MYITIVVVWHLFLRLASSVPLSQDPRNETSPLEGRRIECDDVPTRYFDPKACIAIFKSMETVYNPHEAVAWTGDGSDEWITTGCRLNVEFATSEREKDEFAVSEVVQVSKFLFHLEEQSPSNHRITTE